MISFFIRLKLLIQVLLKNVVGT